MAKKENNEVEEKIHLLALGTWSHLKRNYCFVTIHCNLFAASWTDTLFVSKVILSYDIAAS